MDVPDFGLPFELTVPSISRATVAALVLAAVAGVLTADVLLRLRPFSRRSRSRVISLISLAGLVACCLALGALVGRGPLAFVCAGVAMLEAPVYWRVYARVTRDRGADPAGVLSDAELRRNKTNADRWVLVLGPDASGKTTLIQQMLAAATPRLVGPVRSAQDGRLRATEVLIDNLRGGAGTLRIWEASSIEGRTGRLPSLDDFDAVVVTIDPLQHAPIADSFPAALRRDRGADDANESVLQLAGALRGDCLAWAVTTKSDLLRFSVHPALLELPLQPGPGWHQQVRSMDIRERRRLAETIGLEQVTREHEPAFMWGIGSPWFAYAGGSNGLRPLGAPDLMRELLDAMWPGWGP